MEQNEKRTGLVYLHGEASKIAVWIAFVVVYLLCAVLAFDSVMAYSWTGVIFTLAIAGFNTVFFAVFQRGFFELRGDEHAVEEVLGNPTRRVFCRGWGWQFWPTRGFKRFLAKDSYALVVYAGRSYDNVAFSGCVVTASRINPHIVQRGGEWVGTARVWHILDDTAREQKRNQATEQVAVWVISGFNSDEIHLTHDLQNMMFSGRLRLAEWDEFLRKIGVTDVDDARKVRQAFDQEVGPAVIDWFHTQYLLECHVDAADEDLDTIQKARYSNQLAFYNRLMSRGRSGATFKNRDILVEMLKTEDPDKDFSRYEYSAGEQFLPGCAFKNRIPAKNWADAQERKAATQAMIDAYQQAANAALAAGARVPADHALAMAAPDVQSFVFVGEGGGEGVMKMLNVGRKKNH